MDDRLRRIIVPAAILLAGCALFVVYAYPGYMSYDSAWQLREARSGWLTDWHPPLMAEIWRCVDRVVPGPAGMLAIQTSCFVAGLWALLARRFSAITTPLFVVAILLFPPIALLLGLHTGKLTQAIYVGYDDTSPVAHAPSDAQAALQAAALACGTSWLMRPFVYLAVVLCLLPLVVRARDRLLAGLVASSLLSEAALFFLSPTPDFRYSIWLVFSCTVVVVMLFAQRWKQR